MKRTQIYLDESTAAYLKKESELEHKSVSEIIRESIHDRMRHNKSDLVDGINSAFGVWKDRDFDTEEYIRDLRKDRSL